MSTRQFVRRLGGVRSKRPFSSTSSLPLSNASSTTTKAVAENGGGAVGRSTAANATGGGGGPGQQPPKWSGRSVFALTATAGVLGWGLAATTLQEGPHKKHAGRVMLFDSKTPNPQYASLDEMEHVGFIVYFISPTHLLFQNKIK